VILRLVAPLLLLTCLFWLLTFALPRSVRRRSLTTARHISIAFGAALLVLVVVNLLFNMGSLIQ
jgi:hypothetical protein